MPTKYEVFHSVWWEQALVLAFCEPWDFPPEAKLKIFGVYSLCISFLFGAPLWKFYHLALLGLLTPPNQLRETSRLHLSPLSLRGALQAFPESKLEVTFGLTSFVSHLSDIIVVCCLMSNVLSTIVSYSLPRFFKKFYLFTGYVGSSLLQAGFL